MKLFLRKKGFTLIELIVTIAVIAILGTFVSISATYFVRKANEKAERTGLESAHSSCMAIFTELNSGYSTIETSDLLSTFRNRIGNDIVQLSRLSDGETAKTNGDALSSYGYYIWYRYGKKPIYDESGRLINNAMQKNEYYLDTIILVGEKGDIWKIQNDALSKNGLVQTN